MSVPPFRSLVGALVQVPVSESLCGPQNWTHAQAGSVSGIWTCKRREEPGPPGPTEPNFGSHCGEELGPPGPKNVPGHVQGWCFEDTILSPENAHASASTECLHSNVCRTELKLSGGCAEMLHMEVRPIFRPKGHQKRRSAMSKVIPSGMSHRVLPREVLPTKTKQRSSDPPFMLLRCVCLRICKALEAA